MPLNCGSKLMNEFYLFLSVRSGFVLCHCTAAAVCIRVGSAGSHWLPSSATKRLTSSMQLLEFGYVTQKGDLRVL